MPYLTLCSRVKRYLQGAYRIYSVERGETRAPAGDRQRLAQRGGDLELLTPSPLSSSVPAQRGDSDLFCQNGRRQLLGTRLRLTANFIFEDNHARGDSSARRVRRYTRDRAQGEFRELPASRAE